MAIIWGGESEYIKTNKKKHNTYWIILFSFLILVLFIYVFNLKNLFVAPPMIAFGIMIAVLIIFKLVDPYINHEETESRKWGHGLRGEQVILAELKKLPDDYTVFQGLHINNEKSDIDFIVVGPNGIFAIEAKSHKGNISFDGHQLTRNGTIFEKDFLEQTIGETLKIHNYLKTKLGREMFVIPIIVFASEYAYMHFGQKPVKNNIKVVHKKWLIEVIRKNFDNIDSREEVIESLKKLISPSIIV